MRKLLENKISIGTILAIGIIAIVGFGFLSNSNTTPKSIFGVSEGQNIADFKTTTPVDKTVWFESTLLNPKNTNQYLESYVLYSNKKGLICAVAGRTKKPVGLDFSYEGLGGALHENYGPPVRTVSEKGERKQFFEHSSKLQGIKWVVLLEHAKNSEVIYNEVRYNFETLEDCIIAGRSSEENNL